LPLRVPAFARIEVAGEGIGAREPLLRTNMIRIGPAWTLLGLVIAACGGDASGEIGETVDSGSASHNGSVTSTGAGGGRSGGTGGMASGAAGSGEMSGGDIAGSSAIGGTNAVGGSGGGAGSANNGGSNGAGGSKGAGGSNGAAGGVSADAGASTNPCDAPGLVWKTGAKTNFTSYPDPGSAECIQYSGCMYEGQFAACPKTETQSWVMAHNIVAVFPDLATLKLHDLCLKSGTKTIVVTAIDECGNNDCNNCCTRNKGNADELIDVESYTNARWGVPDGRIQWADLGPTKGSGCQ
jgi:hypothetical protein